MFDLTDNQFYPSAKRIWLCISFNYSSLSGATIDFPILAKKKVIFSDEAHFDFGGYVNKQYYNIWGTHILKSRRTQNGFWSTGINGRFILSFTDRVGYCMDSRGIHLNEIMLCSNKKRNLRKHSVVFFKASSKKKLFGGSCTCYS